MLIRMALLCARRRASSILRQNGNASALESVEQFVHAVGILVKRDQGTFAVFVVVVVVWLSIVKAAIMMLNNAVTEVKGRVQFAFTPISLAPSTAPTLVYTEFNSEHFLATICDGRK